MWNYNEIINDGRERMRDKNERKGTKKLLMVMLGLFFKLLFFYPLHKEGGEKAREKERKKNIFHHLYL